MHPNKMNDEGVFCGDKKLIVNMVRFAAWLAGGLKKVGLAT